MTDDFEKFADGFVRHFQAYSMANDAKQSRNDKTLNTRIAKIRTEIADTVDASQRPVRVLVLSETATVEYPQLPLPTDADTSLQKALSAINAMRTKSEVSTAIFWLTFRLESIEGKTTWLFDRAEMEDENNPRCPWKTTHWIEDILAMQVEQD